jgi:hypothetical protein
MALIEVLAELHSFTLSASAQIISLSCTLWMGRKSLIIFKNTNTRVTINIHHLLNDDEVSTYYYATRGE